MMEASADLSAFAGGCLLAMCCDFRIMGTGKAWISMNEVFAGMPLSYAVAAIVSTRVDKRLYRDITLGKRWTAYEARDVGIIDEVVDNSVDSRAVIDRAVALGEEKAPLVASGAWDSIKVSDVGREAADLISTGYGARSASMGRAASCLSTRRSRQNGSGARWRKRRHTCNQNALLDSTKSRTLGFLCETVAPKPLGCTAHHLLAHNVARVRLDVSLCSLCLLGNLQPPVVSQRPWQDGIKTAMDSEDTLARICARGAWRVKESLHHGRNVARW